MRRLLPICIACALCAAACNQSDPPADEQMDYFPLVDGARYRYLHSKGGWIETLTFEADEDDENRFVQRQSENDDGESSSSVLVRDDGDVLRVSEEQFIDGELDYSTEYDPGFLRFSAAWANGEKGASETRTYDRTETQPGLEPKTRPRAHVFTVVSLAETVKVPAGQFLNCLMIRRERDLDNDAIAEADVTQDEQSKMFWFCPGVGKVREENLITGSREELIDYQLPED